MIYIANAVLIGIATMLLSSATFIWIASRAPAWEDFDD